MCTACYIYTFHFNHLLIYAAYEKELATRRFSTAYRLQLFLGSTPSPPFSESRWRNLQNSPHWLYYLFRHCLKVVTRFIKECNTRQANTNSVAHLHPYDKDVNRQDFLQNLNLSFPYVSRSNRWKGESSANVLNLAESTLNSLKKSELVQKILNLKVKAGFQHADFSASVWLSAFKHVHNQLDRQKKLAYAEKIVCKKVELQATFFVRLVRSLIDLWFSTNQIEETNKQIRRRWRGVYHSLMAMLSVWKTV